MASHTDSACSRGALEAEVNVVQLGVVDVDVWDWRRVREWIPAKNS